MLIFLILVWLFCGLGAYFLQNILEHESDELMSLPASLLMGVIGLVMVITEFFKTRE